ncbi:MAG: TetR/AcrR family transcriptional regulator [Clostridia bacterium]|nr:TetR/AcrR family transcriptional regulator [Clostridia bacterium]
MTQQSSKEKIQRAMLFEMKRTHYSKVTVSAIIQLAGINRSTFYRYYTDIIDLYNDISTQLIAKILLPLDTAESFNADPKKIFFDISDKISKSRMQYSNEFSVLCSENGNSDFIVRLRNKYNEKLYSLLKSGGMPEKAAVEAANTYSDNFIICALENHKSAYFNPEPKYHNPNFQFGLNKTVAENSAEYISSLGLGTVSSIYGKMFPVLISLCNKYHFKPFRINEFMELTGIHRTVFYRYFNNVNSMISTLFTCFAHVVARYALLIVTAESVNAEMLTLKKETDFSREAAEIFKNPMHEHILIDFFASVYHIVLSECNVPDEDSITKSYICDILRCMRYYLTDFDEEAFILSVEKARKIKSSLV